MYPQRYKSISSSLFAAGTTKEDKQMKNITHDFKNYFNTISEYENYLKELIKKYNIKQTGNTIKSSI